MAFRGVLTRTLSPSQNRRKKWQQNQNHTLDWNDSVVWPIRTRTRIFLPFFSWTDTPLANLKEVIGSGKFSKVHKGHLLASKRRFSVDAVDSSPGSNPGHPVAIKVINKSVVLSEPGLANQLNQETRIHHVCCNHPNVLNMTRSWQDEHHLFMAFELCNRGTLHHLWSEHQGPFPDAAIGLAALQLGSALEYIHGIGVMHRDVKMENILINSKGNLLLTDFGMALWLGKREKTTSICGTLTYMAPEVLTASTSQPYGQAADLWSLGVTLFALKFDKLPFSKAPDHHAMFDNLKSNFSSVLSNLKPDTYPDNLILNLMTFDPAERLLMKQAEPKPDSFIEAFESCCL